MAKEDSRSKPPTILRRRNPVTATLTLSTTPKLTQIPKYQNGDVSPFSLDVHLISVGSSPRLPSYTSLKDVLPYSYTAISSPSPRPAYSGDLPLRNRLVKQAASAYLTPTAAALSASSGGRSFFSSLCLRLSAIIRLLNRALCSFCDPAIAASL